MNRKPYVQKQDKGWWIKHPYYRFYMLREATSVPIFIYVLILMWGLLSLGQGEDSFAHWVEVLKSPWMQFFHAIVIAAALLHAYTWFQLTPKILVVWLGKFRVPDMWVKLGNYGFFVISSAAILCLAFKYLVG